MSEPPTFCLPASCERAILERFLRAEAMALWAVRSAQASDIPPTVLAFLRRHEADEQRHLRAFEQILGTASWGRSALPQVPRQWHALAVQLYGYEALGLEFARLLAALRPDLASILADEERHVAFFERQVRALLSGEEALAQRTRVCARAWWRRLPRTLDRYLGDAALAAHRRELRESILLSLAQRLLTVGLPVAQERSACKPARSSPACGHGHAG